MNVTKIVTIKYKNNRGTPFATIMSKKKSFIFENTLIEQNIFWIQCGCDVAPKRLGLYLFGFFFVLFVQ